MELETGDIVLCTVDRIVGTIVFVKIDGNGEGSIILSEIAPGRIRNLRDYVVPMKKIVCKVLRIIGDRIDLSLRRVTPKEKKELMDKQKLEKSYISVLKSVLGKNAEEIIIKITNEEKIYDFLEEAKVDSSKLKKIVGNENAKKVLDILNAQKQKKSIIKKEFQLRTTKPNGLEIIKKILEKINEAEIKYLSAGNYSIKLEGTDLKSTDNKLKQIIEEIEKSAKKEEAEFKIIGK